MLGDALKTNTTLTELWLDGKQQDHKETQQESKASTTARGVNWAGNWITVEGARALGDALKTNTTLAVLGLWCEQQDHKQTQQESKESTMAREVTGRQQDRC